MVAPKALPADGTPPPGAVALATPPIGAPATAPANGAPLVANTPPTVAAAAATPEAEPEVRRAEPVRPEDLMQARNATAPETVPEDTSANRFDIRPLREDLCPRRGR